MNRLTALIAAALVAGCATPSEMKTDGVRAEYTLRLPAPEAARCVTRNAEEFHRWYEVSPRDVGGGSYEIHVRTSGNLVAVAAVSPKGTGSHATIWRTPMPGFANWLPDAMAKGC